jgi:hypothetical protein
MSEIDIRKKVWCLFGIPVWSIRETISESEFAGQVEKKVMDRVDKQLDEMVKMLTGNRSQNDQQQR